MAASSMSKQLGDFLQEQQEPFTMELYLHERGYPRTNSPNFFKGSTSFAPKKRRKSLPSCLKMVRAVFSRLVQSEANRKIKNGWNNNDEVGNGNCKQDLAEEEDDDDDHFSSASSSTVFNSCPESDAEDEGSSVLHEKQVFEDRKQLSPVSVLEETESSAADDDDDLDHDASSPIHQIEENEEARKEMQSLDCERRKAGRSVSSQYSRNRKAIQQTKQLLFDCVSEVIESHRRKEVEGQKQLQNGRILDPEQLWRLICESIWEWSQEAIDETNINQLVHLGFLDSVAGWMSFHGMQQAQEIGVIVSEIILEDIRDEIVTEMVISLQ